MSRIGREPITVPAGVQVNVADANVVTVKGPLGTLTQQLHPTMDIELNDGILNVKRRNDSKEQKALHGLTRTLLNNMIVGVKDGYQKKLVIVGVGYRASKSGKTLTLNLGYSHPIYFEEESDLTFEVPDPNTVIVKSPDKQKCGQVASEIRGWRPPEPYLGKGVKYEDERIRRKAGKTGK